MFFSVRINNRTYAAPTAGRGLEVPTHNALDIRYHKEKCVSPEQIYFLIHRAANMTVTGPPNSILSVSDLDAPFPVDGAWLLVPAVYLGMS